MSTTHNKNLYSSLNLLTNCMSARSVLQILPIKCECTFLFSNLIIIGLCNYSANSLLEIISFLTDPPDDFYQKSYKKFKHLKQGI